MKCRLPLVALLLLGLSPWPGPVKCQTELTENEIIKKYGNPIKKELETKFSKTLANDCKAGKEETLNHQLFLYTNYRGLFDYRLHHHFYQLYDKGDAPDMANYTGSVVFLNYQDTSTILNCPCGEAASWKMYGRGSKPFNDDKRKSTKKPYRFKAPAQRFYYRTYSCQSGSYIHYFNVFTRPLALTSTPPLMFTEKLKGPANAMDQVTCDLSMYKRIKEKPARFYYIPTPFQFYWQFPKKEQPKDVDRYYEGRPPIDDGTLDNLFWDEQTLRDNTKVAAHLPDEEFLKLKSMDTTKLKDICETGGKGGLLSDTAEHVLLGTALHFPKSGAKPEHEGFYACIVVDGNGLSSAYWWDGDDHPLHDSYRGFTYIRVRAVVYTIVAVCIFIGLFVVTALMILILPDNKEDFTSDAPEEPEPIVTNQIDDTAPRKSLVLSVKSVTSPHNLEVRDVAAAGAHDHDGTAGHAEQGKHAGVTKRTSVVNEQKSSSEVPGRRKSHTGKKH